MNIDELKSKIDNADLGGNGFIGFIGDMFGICFFGCDKTCFTGCSNECASGCSGSTAISCVNTNCAAGCSSGCVSACSSGLCSSACTASGTIEFEIPIIPKNQ